MIRDKLTTKYFVVKLWVSNVYSLNVITIEWIEHKKNIRRTIDDELMNELLNEL